jgi:uncharacterized protein YgiM (DUF1202 family)
MSYCTKCGKQNPGIAKYCTGCGIALVLNQSATASVKQDAEYKRLRTLQSKNRKKILLIAGIIFLIAAGFAAFFLFFKRKKEEAIMMVVPDVLKLRSSKSDAADDNVLGSAAYGASVIILDSSDIWYGVKYDGKKGYMHSKHLCLPKDFVEIKAIIRSAGSMSFEGAQKITESRFKKSLLKYFRIHNYLADIPEDEKEKYFSKEELVSKTAWRIKGSSPEAFAFIKGNFTYSDKKGIAVIIENNSDSSKRKLLVFNYNTDETEASVVEFDEPFLHNIWLGLKDSESYTDLNGNYYRPGFDFIHCNISNKQGIYLPFKIFLEMDEWKKILGFNRQIY